jgi:hypothetical protein
MKKMEICLQMNLLEPGPDFIKKNLPGCCVMKVENQCLRLCNALTVVSFIHFTDISLLNELMSEFCIGLRMALG